MQDTRQEAPRGERQAVPAPERPTQARAVLLASCWGEGGEQEEPSRSAPSTALRVPLCSPHPFILGRACKLNCL